MIDQAKMEPRDINKANPVPSRRDYRGKGKGIGKGKSNRHLMETALEEDVLKRQQNKGNPAALTKESPAHERIFSIVGADALSSCKNCWSEKDSKLYAGDSPNVNDCSREDPLMADLQWTTVQPNEERIPRFGN